MARRRSAWPALGWTGRTAPQLARRRSLIDLSADCVATGSAGNAVWPIEVPFCRSTPALATRTDGAPFPKCRDLGTRSERPPSDM